MENGTNAADIGLYELSTVELVFWFIIYAVIAVLAVGGNLLVLVVILTTPRMQSVTNYFIANLAVGDFMTGLLAIPFKFQAALYQEWFLPPFTCKTATFSETVSLSVSVFTLTCTAADRFRAIMSPKSAKMSRQMAVTIISVIWVFSLTQSLPFGLFHRVKLFTDEPPSNNSANVSFSDNSSSNGSLPFTYRSYQCYPVYNEMLWWKVYNVYLTVITYFVPLFIVDLCYCVIGYHVWSTQPVMSCPKGLHREAPVPGTTYHLNPVAVISNNPQTIAFERSKRKVIKMLCIVVLVFTFCWLPYETYLVLNEVRPHINDWHYINIVFFACHWLAMSNSCLNPIIYGIYNEKFQREYKNVLLRCFGRGYDTVPQMDDRSSVIPVSVRSSPMQLPQTNGADGTTCRLPSPAADAKRPMLSTRYSEYSMVNSSESSGDVLELVKKTKKMKQKYTYDKVNAFDPNLKKGASHSTLLRSNTDFVCMDYIASELGRD